MTSHDWVQQVIFAAITIAVVIDYLTLGIPSSFAWERLPLLTVGLIFIMGLDLALANKSHLRRIEIDSTGISFVFLLHSERALWSELEPAPFPARLGDWGIYRNITDSRGSIKRRGITLTVAQGRAILAYPTRPYWDIPEHITASLGIRTG